MHLALKLQELIVIRQIAVGETIVSSKKMTKNMVGADVTLRVRIY